MLLYCPPTAGEDYIPFNETRIVTPDDIIGDEEGSWSYCVEFCTKDDNIVEGDESFYIVISPHTDRIKPFNNVQDRLKVNIQDNDGKFSKKIFQKFVPMLCDVAARD